MRVSRGSRVSGFYSGVDARFQKGSGVDGLQWLRGLGFGGSGVAGLVRQRLSL